MLHMGFQDQTDFIYFIYGLSFILLGFACLQLGTKEHAKRIPWRLLGAFALIHGTLEWLELLKIVFGDSPPFHMLRLVFLASSFLALLEFGRKAWIAGGGKAPGRWILLALLALPSYGYFLDGLQGASAMSRYALCLPGGIWAAAALLRLSRKVQEGSIPLLAIAAALGLYGLAGGLVVAPADFFPASALNTVAFKTAAGFPVAILRAALACAMLIATWAFFNSAKRREEGIEAYRSDRRHALLLALGMLCLAVLSFFALQWIGEREGNRGGNLLLRRAQHVVRELNTDCVKRLSCSIEDLDKADYLALKEKMRTLKKDNPDIRFFYIIRLVGGEPAFQVDSEEPGSKDESPPGQVFKDASPTLLNALKTEEGFYEGPVSDEWGTWISGLASIRDKTNSRFLGFLGIDRDINDFKEHILKERFKAIVILGMLCLAALLGMTLWKHTKIISDDRTPLKTLDTLLLRGGMACVVMFLGASMTLLIFFELRREAEFDYEDAFIREANERVEPIVKACFSLMETLESARRFMEFSLDRLDRSAFEKNMNALVSDSRYTIKAIAWQPRVTHAGRAAFERDVLSRSIMEQISDGIRMPARDRDEYFPTTFFAPLKGNASIAGINAFSSPEMREAMEKARDEGVIVSSPPLKLPYEAGVSHTAFLLVAPIYAEPHAELKNAEERRKALRGYLTLTCKPEQLVKDILGPMPALGLDKLIEDTSAPEGKRLLHMHHSRTHSPPAEKDDQRVFEKSFDFGGRIWRITVTPNEAFVDNNKSQESWWALYSGLFLSLVLSLYLNSLLEARLKAERLVRRRTAELDAEKERLEVTLHSIGDGMISIDGQGLVTMLNPVAETLTGWTEKEASGRRIEDVFQIIDERSGEKMENPARTVLSLGRPLGFANHTTLISNNGSKRQISHNAAPILGRERNIAGAILVFRDVTEEYRHKEQLQALNERFSLATESSGIGVWEWFSKSKALVWNDTMKSLYGFEGQEFKPTVRIWRSSVHPGDRKRVHESLRLALAGEDLKLDTEFRIVRPDGEVKTLKTIAKGERQDGGVHVTGVSYDITGVKQAQAELARQTSILQGLIDSIPDIIFFKNVNGVYIGGNNALSSLLGLPLEKIVGKTDMDLFPNDSAAKFKEQDKETRQGKALHIEETLSYPDGRKVTVDTLKAPLRNRSGEFIGILGVSRDITERKKTEEALRRYNTELKRETERANEMAMKAQMASAAKSQFVANMSHEIRTPMNAIMGMAGLLEDSPLDPEQRQMTEAIRSNTEALLSIVNNILDFSKVESGRAEVEALDFDLRQSLEGLADVFAKKTLDKGVELCCVAEKGVPYRVRGELGRLRQILACLLDNAVKFTEQGEVCLKVTRLQEKEEPGRVVLRFAVSDTGIGIPKERMEDIFTPFKQLNSSIKRKYGGTGLGLAMAKRLVDIIDGDLDVISQEGKGSCFTLTCGFDALEAGDSIENTGTNSLLTGLKILAFNPKENPRRQAMSILASFGCSAEEAATPSEAMEKLLKEAERKASFNAVLLELNDEGFALARLLRADERLKEIPLIAIVHPGFKPEDEKLKLIAPLHGLEKPLRAQSLAKALKMAAGIEKPEAERNEPKRGEPKEDSRRFRILLAEDNPTSQLVGLQTLSKMGHLADAVSNGAEAVAALMKVPYDLVLMDCQMPEMDGYEAARLIRNPETGALNPRIPIIAVTGNAIQTEKDKCVAAGITGIIAKPIQRKELASMIEHCFPKEGAPPLEGEFILPGQGANADQRIFNEGELLERLSGDRELFSSVVISFMDDTRRQLGIIKERLAEGDAHGISLQAQNIKGSAANVSANALRSLATELEKAAAKEDLQKALDLTLELDGALRELEATLKESKWL